MYVLNREKYEEVMKSRGRDALTKLAHPRTEIAKPTLTELLTQGKTLSEIPSGLSQAPNLIISTPIVPH